MSTPVATVVTASVSAQNLHTVGYVTPIALAGGSHTIRIQAGTTSKVDANDRITYSYLCWN